MGTLKQCVITICATTMIIALGLAYLAVVNFPFTMDLLGCIAFIMAGVVSICITCIRYTYLTHKLEIDKKKQEVEALNSELERKKEWAIFEAELKAKEIPLKKEWKIFEQELFIKEKEVTINEKKRNSELVRDEKKVDSELMINEKKVISQLAIDEGKVHSEITIAEKQAAINRVEEIKKLGISISTGYDPNK